MEQGYIKMSEKEEVEDKSDKEKEQEIKLEEIYNEEKDEE